MLALHRILCHGLQPDLTILMDSEVAASVERARRRNQIADNPYTPIGRFESKAKLINERHFDECTVRL